MQEKITPIPEYVITEFTREVMQSYKVKVFDTIQYTFKLPEGLR